jgi:N-acetylmuramoyl-L-alanine amidase
MKKGVYHKAMLNAVILSLLVLVVFGTASAQVQGLSDWTIFLDPGHSRTENMGLYGYSEAEKVLRIALALRGMLEEQTDIDTVYLSRTNDQQQVSLSERTDHANSVNADFYYSIHSDAGGSSANSTLFLHGGWRENGVTVEKTPQGGKRMGDIMDTHLPNHMRIPTRGNYADRTFYQGFPDTHTNTWPYLHVNRESNMASVLSEGGFHTSPTQQPRNMNAEWKRLEAQSAFWSILEYHDLERPTIGIVTGYVSDIESGRLINGATVTINGQSYTTDTYETLFYRYSKDPEQLRNGFYYLEGLPVGETFDVYVEADGFYPDTLSVSVLDSEMTFRDIKLLSSAPPYVVSTLPADSAEGIRPTGYVLIDFSRPMNRDSVQHAFSIEPELDITLLWANNDTRTGFGLSMLDFNTQYTLTIGEGAEDVHGHKIDGNRDGEPGGVFTLTFTMGPEDIVPPRVTERYPANNATDVPRFPVISFTFDEEIAESSITGQSITLTGPDQTVVTGSIKQYDVGLLSVLQFFPDEELDINAQYTATLVAGIEDLYGNAIGSNISTSFRTESKESHDRTTVDNFNSGVSSWWEPSMSGSTSGYIAEETERLADNSIVNGLFGSTGSLRINYGYDPSLTPHLIRVHTPGTGTPASVRFDASYIVQAYVFGDGSGNRFRFVLRDSFSNGLEASSWYTVDWLGWRLVSWDLTSDPIIGWVTGNGVINPPTYIDSFQLTWTPDAPNIGFVNIDDFHIVRKTVVGVERIADIVPGSYRLAQNYPNPFNPSTTIRYSLPEESHVKIEIYNMLGQKVTTLVDEMQDQGTFEVTWTPVVSSGMYFYRLEATSQIDPDNRFVDIKRMTLLK